MTRRRLIGVGAATTAVLAAVSGALINELHGGWGWFVAPGGVVLVGAVLTGWLAVQSGGGEDDGAGDQLGPGAVKAGRDIRGSVTTHTTITSDGTPTRPPEAP